MGSECAAVEVESSRESVSINIVLEECLVTCQIVTYYSQS